MGQLCTWFENNNFTANVSKTKTIFFSISKKPDTPFHPSKVLAIKFLGIEIDHRLQWTMHIDKLAKNLASVNFLILNLKPILKTELLLTAYFGLFQSKVSYGIQFWGGNTSGLQRISIIQKQIIRNIFSLGYTESCKTYFKSNKILTVLCLYIQLISLLMNEGKIETISRTHSHNTRFFKKCTSGILSINFFSKTNRQCRP